jgi:hypothetical protein
MAGGIVTYTLAKRAVEITRTGRKVGARESVFFNEVGSNFYWPINLLHAHHRLVKRNPGTRRHRTGVRESPWRTAFSTS